MDLAQPFQGGVGLSSSLSLLFCRTFTPAGGASDAVIDQTVNSYSTHIRNIALTAPYPAIAANSPLLPTHNSPLPFLVARHWKGRL
jgi:hypothetical protein